MALPGKEYPIENINIAVWVAIGALIGWAASSFVMKPDTHTVFLENMALAVLGSFVGGEFVAVLLRSDPKSTGITLGAVALAGVCSVVALLLLRTMRRVVGPLRSGKAKRAR